LHFILKWRNILYICPIIYLQIYNEYETIGEDKENKATYHIPAGGRRVWHFCGLCGQDCPMPAHALQKERAGH